MVRARSLVSQGARSSSRLSCARASPAAAAAFRRAAAWIGSRLSSMPRSRRHTQIVLGDGVAAAGKRLEKRGTQRHRAKPHCRHGQGPALIGTEIVRHQQQYDRDGSQHRHCNHGPGHYCVGRPIDVFSLSLRSRSKKRNVEHGLGRRDVKHWPRLTRQPRCHHQRFRLAVPSRFLLLFLPVDAVARQRYSAVKSLSCVGLSVKAQMCDARLRHATPRRPVAAFSAPTSSHSQLLRSRNRTANGSSTSLSPNCIARMPSGSYAPGSPASARREEQLHRLARNRHDERCHSGARRRHCHETGRCIVRARLRSAEPECNRVALSLVCWTCVAAAIERWSRSGSVWLVASE